MECPYAAGEGTAYNVEGSGEYIEYGVAESRQGVILQLWGWGHFLTTPHRENVSLLRNIHKQSIGPGLSIWYDISYEIGKWEIGETQL
jgi:hypothetical protein